LPFNFVVAAHLVSALPSSVFVRLASGAFYKTIILMTFCEIIKWDNPLSRMPEPLTPPFMLFSGEKYFFALYA